ncbi:serine--tRNA ligase, mitochondrial [Anopheles moucheti]|uniref:serine--tRNA ligase, mitochondrial n=1 Tax=Anopheles moucheti TaxID=186751 RepID=UPI0022F09FAB|nr:serine--tRNA ligase, mitochondrial [Anopheles moucheti]XP_052900868.1 serine--tRNA ligase, mitochondrial [Anopheles moucheti]
MFVPKCVVLTAMRHSILRLIARRMSQQRFNLQEARFDTEYLLNLANRPTIETNIQHRKGIGDIQLVHKIQEQLSAGIALTESERATLKSQLQLELSKIPNRTHPQVLEYGNEPRILRRFNEQHKRTDRKYFQFSDICKKMNLYRMENLGNFTGHRSYYLTDELAELEHALINYTVEGLRRRNFQLITVPDLLPGRIIESCGMSVHGERNQVYKLTSDARESLCLSGTSEMALAGYFAGRVIPAETLPYKLMAVSRCYRAETSALQEEKGIYRVHQFTKVEMFAVCRPDQSAAMLEEFRDIEVSLFDKLGLHFLLLDMPPCELGAPAYRKYDIEAWMPGRGMYGEISSCSDCTDYQARRLGICVTNDDTDRTETFAHTVNGTACAIPRMLIALMENFQNEDYSITIPEALRKFMNGKQFIRRRKVLPELKLTKRLVQEETF